MSSVKPHSIYDNERPDHNSKYMIGVNVALQSIISSLVPWGK